MDKILRLVSQRSKTSIDSEDNEKPAAYQPPAAISSKETNDNSTDPPNPTRDPHVIQELINSVDSVYYSLAFDSGKYEIENVAGPNCRELAKLKLRLLALDRQNKAVSRRVSELVLEKHPRYEAELKGVLSLQSDNWETLCMCRQIRSSLKQADESLVISRLIVLRNYRRQIRLQQTLNVLFQLRNLQNNVHKLDTLIKQGEFYDAIRLYRESLVLLEDFRSYRCIEPIHVKLKASELRIDEKLDSELQRSCEHFDDKAYSTVQRAFELLGSTQTTFAQLQMHYVAAIQRRSFNLVQVHLDTPSSHMIDISGDNSDHSSYSDMCQQLPHWTLLPCLRAICQNMWQILLCYHCTIQWHKNRAAGKSSKSASKSPQLNCNPFSSDTLLMKSKQHKTKLKDGETDSNISNNNMTTGDNDSAIVITDRNSPLSKSSSVTNDDHGCDPELARQWHDYVACKLDSGRSRIWSEIISRIEPILSVVGLVARDMTFDQIASLLTTVNHFVHIGEEFCECPANELLEALRISIQKYFKDFHRKHMERLKMFLENETWEICPVKRSFTVMDLQEFRAVKDLFEQNTGSNNNNNNKYTTSGNHKTNQENNSTNVSSKSQKKKLFSSPYTIVQFPINTEDNKNNINNNSSSSNNNSKKKSTTTSIETSSNHERNSPNSLLGSTSTSLSIETKKWSNTNSSYEDNDDYNEENLSSAQNDLSDDKSLPVGHNGPLFSTTTLEVLRLIGRYLQMMRLLQPIAGEVMHCLCQVFDYYLYSILNLFGSPQISNSAELPERLRTTLKRINERLIAVDGHPSVLAGDRFSLPLRGPIDLFNTCNSPTEISSTVTGTNGAERECQLVHCLQIYVVSVESVICLADILETVLLPHLTACLPDNKRGLALVFREQSLMAARQIREPCATGLAPQLLNIIIPKMNDASSAKYPRQSTTSNSNASNTSSFSRIWPIGSSLSQQQNQSDKESPNTTTTANTNSPPQNPANITPVNSPLTTNSVDILAMHICALNWSTKEVANTPNTYINNINTYIFYPFSLTIQNISQKFNLQNHIMIIVIWNALLACLATQLLEAFGRVQQCSDEGRGQMLLDVQTLAVYAQSASKIRLDHVIEYIQAFYIPVHEWEHWLTNCGTKYSRAQLTGLASCLSRSDKRQYQRLLNTINQIYNNNSNNNNNNNTTNQATHSSFSNNLLANTAS